MIHHVIGWLQLIWVHWIDKEKQKLFPKFQFFSCNLFQFRCAKIWENQKWRTMSTLTSIQNGHEMSYVHGHCMTGHDGLANEKKWNGTYVICKRHQTHHCSVVYPWDRFLFAFVALLYFIAQSVSSLWQNKRKHTKTMKTEINALEGERSYLIIIIIIVCQLSRHLHSSDSQQFRSFRFQLRVRCVDIFLQFLLSEFDLELKTAMKTVLCISRNAHTHKHIRSLLLTEFGMFFFLLLCFIVFSYLPFFESMCMRVCDDYQTAAATIHHHYHSSSSSSCEMYALICMFWFCQVSVLIMLRLRNKYSHTQQPTQS